MVLQAVISLYAIIAVVFMGCAPTPPVRMDLDTYIKNSGQHNISDILIAADIADLMVHKEILREKDVEVAGLVRSFGAHNFWTWYIILEKNGHQIRCYAHQYRVEPGRDALHMVRWVQAEHGELTISGTLKNDGIAIRYMRYKGDLVTPYYKPSDHYFLPWRPLTR